MGKALLSPDPTRLLSPSHSWVYDRFVLFPFSDLSLVSLASGDHSISMPFPFVQQVRLSVACLSSHSSVTWLSSLLPGDARLPWVPKVLGITRLKRRRGLGGMREGTVGEFGMDVYTLLCLRQIANKDLLYSTGNSAQCYVATWMGGEFGREWILVCVWLSPFTAHLKPSKHCLLISYTPKQN